VSAADASCRCSRTQPLSWLTLELFQLGELAQDEQRRVSSHLDGCACCRSCLEQIRSDERALPPLPVSLAREARRRWWRSGRGRLALTVAVATAAAVLLVLLLPRGPEQPGSSPPRRIASFKGGELSIGLVRERRGSVQADPSHFAAGDRFKVLVTCPPRERALRGDVVVYQQGAAHFPLPPASPVPCGNLRPLPGAFTLADEVPALVCLVIGDRAPDRALLARAGAQRLGRAPGLDTVCLPLLPVH